jgi:hypothetical protein
MGRVPSNDVPSPKLFSNGSPLIRDPLCGGRALQHPKGFVKPRKRRALSGFQALVGMLLAPLVIAGLMLPSLLLDNLMPDFTPMTLIVFVSVLVVAICVTALLSHVVPARPAREVELPIKQDRMVKVQGRELVQIVNGEIVGSIDTTRDLNTRCSIATTSRMLCLRCTKTAPPWSFGYLMPVGPRR